MEAQSAIKNLHPLEIKILLHYKKDDELSIERVERELGLKPGNGNQALAWLAGKGLIEQTRREPAVFYEVTDLGREWAHDGTPEEQIMGLLEDNTGLRLPDIGWALEMSAKDVGSAFGRLSKLGLIVMDGNKRAALAPQPPEGAMRVVAALRGLTQRAAAVHDGQISAASLSQLEREIMAQFAKKRAAGDAPFRQIDRETVIFTFTTAKDGTVPAEEAAAALRATGVTGEEAGALTPEMLADGSWKGKTFRPYNIKVPPARLVPGRVNPYAQFLEDVKDKLASLGFEEFDGPLVETEFWNSDALFMPQFHSARDIHDVYRLAAPEHARAIEEPWLSNVAAAHENGGATGSRGWGYAFDRDFTRRLILRSQGTVLSAKTLPRAKIPGKYFGIVRCFRYDRVDATHLPDFYQTEGIVLGEDVNLKTLLGMLEMFALEVAGAREVKYVPGYFPFTEPSVEVHIKHPVLGWFELGGSGIFRPEVTESLGVHVPVAAWGIGIDRMALMALGLNDLRDLFSSDIESVRLRRDVRTDPALTPGAAP